MKKVQFILFPEFQMLAYILATETLRLANKSAGAKLFEWSTVSVSDAPVQASNGAEVTPDTVDWQGEGEPELILLCAGYHPRRAISARLRAYLSRADRAGGTIGGLDTGTVILAELGLLDGYRSVLHYEAEADFRESWPNILLSDQIYSLDRRRLTAAGGVATGDAMLAWITREVGKDLAAATSEAMVHGRIRASEEPQRSVTQTDPLLRALTQMMRDHLSEPLALSQICRLLKLSPKQLVRLCKRGTGLAPNAYYLQLRLREGSYLLDHTLMPVTEVALAVGFSSVSGFSRSFSRAFGCSPRAWRNRARG